MEAGILFSSRAFVKRLCCFEGCFAFNPSQGHHVAMYTSHYDPERCFEETKGGKYFDVAVYGDWLPRELAGSLHILFAMLRNAWLAACVALLRSPYDVIICDQVRCRCGCWLCDNGCEAIAEHASWSPVFASFFATFAGVCEHSCAAAARS
jgi:hypothetical protein